MDPKSRDVPYRKSEVAGLQIIKHANLKKPTLRGVSMSRTMTSSVHQ